MSNESSRHAFAIDVIDDDNNEVNQMSIECHSLKSELKFKHKLTRVDCEIVIGNQAACLPMLLDSGATASFINPSQLPVETQEQIEEFLSGNISLNKLELEEIYVTIKAALSKQTVKCAMAKVKCKIGDWTGYHDFIFAKITESAILGLDFLREHKVSSNYGSDEWTIHEGDHVFRIHSVECIDETNRAVSISQSRIVKANTEQIVDVTVSGPIVDKPMLFEPKPASSDDLQQGILWANCLCSPTQTNTVKVSLVNLSNYDVKIHKDAVVGELFEVEWDEISEREGIAVDLNVAQTKDRTKIDRSLLKIDRELTKEQQDQIVAIIEENRSAFQWSEYDTGTTDLVLKNGIIEEGKGPWSSPIILVKKKVREGKQEYRFCVDFRRLNQLTIKDSYPIPRIDETIDALGGSKFFTTLDLASGYWQIPMAVSDREKTAFCANHKLYQFRVMPFGLTNAPSTFQRLMDTLLRGLTWQQCLVYLDDVIILASSFETHLERLGKILAIIKEAKLKLRPDKCEFAKSEVSYLGFLITREGLRPDVNKTRAISELAAPGSKDEAKRFLGMLSYYRRFINRFSSIASCLFELTKAKTVFEWTDEHQKAFDVLKRQLVQAPVLAYPDFDKEFEIYTDASGVGIGGVLVQRNEDRMHPIAFASRQLNRHERNYSTSEREMLAIVWSAKHFKPYIYGRHTRFFTDHKPLSTLVKSKEPTGRLYKLLLKLQDLDHRIEYVPGALNNTADALSRVGLQKAEIEVNKIGVELQVDWSEEQSKDRELAIVRVLVKTG